MNAKQVIVMRTKYPDGNGGSFGLRRGKECAQASHASQAFLEDIVIGNKKLDEASSHWFSSTRTKICVRVESEAELVALYETAKKAGILAHIVEDMGMTEFGGQKTLTAVAIGPAWSEEIDAITSHLKLY